MNDEARNDGLWGYEEVAAYLGVSPKTVRRWAGEKRLPVVKVGALNRFRRSDIEAWVQENAQHVAPAPATEGAA